MLLDIVCISFLDVEKVFIRNVLFVKSFSLFYVLLQFVNRCMQINQQVGLQKLLVNVPTASRA